MTRLEIDGERFYRLEGDLEWFIIRQLKDLREENDPERIEKSTHNLRQALACVKEEVEEYEQFGAKYARIHTATYMHALSHITSSSYAGAGLFDPQGAVVLSETADLLNRSIRFALDVGETQYFDRFVDDVKKYNFEKANDEGDFPFKPQVFSDPRFLEHYKGLLEQQVENYGKISEHTISNLAFIRARNKKEYQENVDKLKLESFDIREIDSQVTSGIYVDVDGTLLSSEYKREGSLEVGVHRYLIDRLNEGREVIVFSGGLPEEQSAKLRAAGVDERLLNVQPKRVYIGKTLEVCVDDTHPELQGFRAQTYMHPSEVKD